MLLKTGIISVGNTNDALPPVDIPILFTGSQEGFGEQEDFGG